MSTAFLAGAASVDITPRMPQHLYGYPHIERISTGVHDPLYTSALYFNNGGKEAMFIANDVIFVPNAIAKQARERIEKITGVKAGHILISASHTHSGPVTVRYLSNEADPAVPAPDQIFLEQWQASMIEAARQARANARPAEIGLAVADGGCLGGNRHDPAGPSDPQVPVLAVRAKNGGPYIGIMFICSIHPTVLHEDSTLISGDFPAMTRRYLQKHLVGEHCPILYHLGAAGNQSPRRITRENTFDEAKRLGQMLGQSLETAIANIAFSTPADLHIRHTFVNKLPLRSFPTVAKAQECEQEAASRFEQLRKQNAPRIQVRTAECDWFGAEETLTLARAAATERLEQVARTCLPAEIQLIQIGPWSFVGWPGEIFVEFALELKKRYPDTFVITLANGELQGYLVTEEAAAQGWYESSNAIFQSPQSGQALVEATCRLLGDVC